MKKIIISGLMVMAGLLSVATSCTNQDKQQHIENTEVVTGMEPAHIGHEPVTANSETGRDASPMDQEDWVDFREPDVKSMDEWEAEDELWESVQAVDSLEKEQEKEKIEEAIQRVK